MLISNVFLSVSDDVALIFLLELCCRAKVKHLLLLSMSSHTEICFHQYILFCEGRSLRRVESLLTESRKLNENILLFPEQQEFLKVYSGKKRN